MDRWTVASLSGLVAGISWASANYDKSFAFDRPIHSAVILLTVTGALLIVLGHILPTRQNSDALSQHRYSPVPHENQRRSFDSRGTSSSSSSTLSFETPPVSLSRLRQLRITFILLTAAIACRAKIIHTIIRNIQCAKANYEPFVPFVAAIFDYFVFRRHSLALPERNEKASVPKRTFGRISLGSYRYVGASFLLGCASIALLDSSYIPKSTYICAETGRPSKFVPALQATAFALDCLIAICAIHIIEAKRHSRSEEQSIKGLAPIGWAALLSATVVTFGGTVFFFAVPDDRWWILHPPIAYIKGISTLAVFLPFVVFFSIHSANRIGTLPTLIIMCFTATLSADFSWVVTNPTPVAPASSVLICLLAAFTSVLISFPTHSDSGEASQQWMNIKPFSRWLATAVLGAVFCIRVMLLIAHSGIVPLHPIDDLIFEAKNKHLAWVKQASTSDTLSAAVQSYRSRYQRSPPPGFDIWFEYATNRTSAIIDDFDSINEDLLPFWSIPAEHVRQQTWELISNPENDAGGIMIRNGQIQISPKVMPTHRWMLEGTAAMIEKFAQWLPDMDIALNINDESRVAVPFEDLEALRSAARSAIDPNKTPKPSFSRDRAGQWRELPEDDNQLLHFEDASFEHIFHRYGIAGCPAQAKAHTERHWQLNQLCATCAAPHSLGQFVSDWNLAASPCHQPDLADLHGLYLAPSRFRSTHGLLPIFSQSKPHGFNDIIFPSPWNYMNKITYGPDEMNPDFLWAEKLPELFWRGGTSEGFSNGSQTWRGMSRQRIVHLLNNDTSSRPVLMPYGIDQLAYENVPSAELRALLPTSTYLVGDIGRCHDPDCSRQRDEFHTVEGIDFQYHWRYKYLLDVDGAGFSGRFMPFLQSNSLVMKAALFREWWSPRLTAWRHFVPLDLRGHGIWGTLAYFHGVQGMANGREVRMEAHELEARTIADEGRRWADKVLRKADMEVYFFRLLLEWGRITDDRRDDIGFTVA